MAFPEAVRDRVYSFNSSLSTKHSAVSDSAQDEQPLDAMYLPPDFKIRPYQETAIQNWKTNGYRGIYDMATGSTVNSESILSRIRKSRSEVRSNV